MGAETIMLLAMGLLLIGSAIASGSETALFRLSPRDLDLIEQTRPADAVRLRELLASPRRMLIIILLMNMAVNVLYFGLSAQLALRQETTLGASAVSIGSLLTLILFGEILAKLLGGAGRRAVAPRVLTPLRIVGTVVLPARWAIEYLVLLPASRLLLPRGPSVREVSDSEMEQLLESGVQSGDLASAEQRLLIGVLALRQMRAREVMRPKRELPIVAARELSPEADREALRMRVAASRLPSLPVFDGGFDDRLVGLLDAKAALTADQNAPLAHSAPTIIPEAALLEQASELMRSRNASAAICVDERGAITGMLTRHDLLTAVASASEPSRETDAITQIEPGRWIVPGGLSVRAWSRFIPELATTAGPRVVTLSGLVMTILGRLPKVGDVARVSNLRIKVLSISGRAADSLEISLKKRKRAST